MEYSTDIKEKPVALIVDDDNTTCATMTAALRKAGFDVKRAADGASGIILFDVVRPDLIFLDVLMPGMDGYETCRAIRNRPGGEYVQIIMVTGLDDTESAEASFQAGANDFLSKPINLTMLGHRAHYMLRAGKAFKDMHLSRSFLAKTQEIAKIGNWKLNFQTDNYTISPEAISIAELSANDNVFTIQDLLQSAIDRDKNKICARVEEAIQKRHSFDVNYQILLPDLSLKHIYMHGEAILSDKKDHEFMIGVIQDSSLMKQAEEEIRYLAFYDSLTGLANKSLFEDRLNKTLDHSERSEQSFALLFLGIDNLSLLNNNLGQSAGDFLLKNTADVIGNRVRRSDSIAKTEPENSNSVLSRQGGDTFVLTLSSLKSPDSAALIASRLLKETQEQLTIDNQEVSALVSIGISVYPDDATDAETLLKHADTAMQHARKQGGNSYQFFKKSINQAVVNRFALERDMKIALKNGDFTLYYQPQLRLSDKKSIGAEALIRWIHPDKGVIPPNEFIPIAEECGLIVEINRFVVNRACAQNRQWLNKGLPPIRIAINLSGYKLAEQNIEKTIKDYLKYYSLDGNAIEVEITENVLLQNTNGITKALYEIKELGIKIALDDFGTGYSSLSYLTSFQVDTIKIDRSFVMGCIGNQRNRVIIRTIIAMGHSLGMG
ncbi:MAG TPA: EAL domain-containing protein, partial [Desulfobacterales bacterium]|nr:EAL domain-containing protein [Desulfobacterales bacterium]